MNYEGEHMDKPYTICHMLVTKNSKVTGDFLNAKKYENCIDAYFRIHREYKADAFLCGRTTMQESFGHLLTLNEQTKTVSTGVQGVQDSIIKGNMKYAIVVDTSGKLLWNHNAIIDEDEGYSGSHIVQVLLENRITEAYLKELESRGISYLFAGKEKLDIQLLLSKLRNDLGISTLLVEGGGITNQAFYKAGAFDELSFVLVDVLEKDTETNVFGGEIVDISKDTVINALSLHEVEDIDAVGKRLVYRRRSL